MCPTEDAQIDDPANIFSEEFPAEKALNQALAGDVVAPLLHVIVLAEEVLGEVVLGTTKLSFFP